jgi:hypothetical protein
MSRGKENSANGRLRSSAQTGACQTSLAHLRVMAYGEVTQAGRARRQVAQHRRHSSEIDKYLSDSALVGLLVLQRVRSQRKLSFRIISTNRATIDLTGSRDLTPADLLGHTTSDLFPCVCENDFAKALLSVIHSGQPQVLGKIHCRDESDTSRSLSIYAFPLSGWLVGVALEKVDRLANLDWEHGEASVYMPEFGVGGSIEGAGAN